MLLNFQVNPSDVGIYDRVVIQELIKTVASSQQVQSLIFISGLYYKCLRSHFTIVLYDRYDSGQYYKTNVSGLTNIV